MGENFDDLAGKRKSFWKFRTTLDHGCCCKRYRAFNRFEDSELHDWRPACLVSNLVDSGDIMVLHATNVIYLNHR